MSSYTFIDFIKLKMTWACILRIGSKRTCKPSFNTTTIIIMATMRAAVNRLKRRSHLLLDINTNKIIANK